MIWLLYLASAAAAGYQIVALLAVLRHLLRRDRIASKLPLVSILKPVHGRDPSFEEAIASHTRIEYPKYELLFGVNSALDVAIPAIRELGVGSLYITSEDRPNAKVANLIELARHAHGEIFVVNDGDIRVTPDYLRRVVAPLEDPRVGLVTCLYRPIPQSMAAAWEALGIATEFAPSTLVAPLVGINEFGLGSTLCFRAADLLRIGGFEPLADYLADDYQLARRLTRGLGKSAHMSTLVVDTSLRYSDWRALWRHQLRWARTIRVSRAEYVGLPVTHAGLWALIAAGCGAWPVAAGLVLLRILTGFTAGFVLLRSPVALALPLIPLWDLWAFAVWLAGLRGDQIEWRGRRMRLSPDGRLS
ncbi:MAG TPA: glycosyltransferase [Bryobacteraceae bacterium]|nr:glycosyltransferase [Bryobacteraceae bacterium]